MATGKGDVVERLFSDVMFARENDIRDVWLNAHEIARLLAACEPWFRPFVLLAIAVGADRSPLMRMLRRDIRIFYDNGKYWGEAYLRDSKTDARPRSVALIDLVCKALLPILEGKDADEHVFNGPPDEKRAMRGLRPLPINVHQVRYWFDKARQDADLEHVRFKDLRRTWAVNADRAGLSLGEMKSGLGHGLDETTVRYTNRQVTLDLEAARQVGQEMGLELPPPGNIAHAS